MPGPLRSPELARKAKERLPSLAVLFTSGYTENAIVHGGRLDEGIELAEQALQPRGAGAKASARAADTSSSDTQPSRVRRPLRSGETRARARLSPPARCGFSWSRTTP